MTIYKAFEIDFTTGDYKVTNGGFTYVFDSEVIRQNIWQTLQINKGEWFIDLEEGVPYITGDDESILGGTSLSTINEDEIKIAILDIEGVVGLQSFEVTQIENNLDILFTVKTIFTDEITLTILV